MHRLQDLHNRYQLQQYAFNYFPKRMGIPDVVAFKTLRATRVDRVTRKVNLADRSAGYQCHSVFTQAYENLLTWLG
jgi:hypothetical protein